MKVTLEEYEPLGNSVLVKPTVKSKSEGGVLLPNEKIERWMEVVKIGSMVTTIEVGDFIIMADPTQIVASLMFGDEQHLQTTEYNLVGRVPCKEGKEIFENITTT